MSANFQDRIVARMQVIFAAFTDRVDLVDVRFRESTTMEVILSRTLTGPEMEALATLYLVSAQSKGNILILWE